jgi:hypothetical protein
MKPTTDEPPRLDYSRAHLEAMPITIDVYSEEATRLFAASAPISRAAVNICEMSTIPAPTKAG